MNLNALKTKIAELSRRAMDLEAELVRTRSMRSALETLEKATAGDPEVLEMALEILQGKQEQPAEKIPSKRGEVRRGLKRDLLYALWTGPSTHSQLARELEWSQKDVVKGLGALKATHLAAKNEHGVWGLTTQGQTQAKWYVDNPGRICYGGEEQG